jgi:ubiquitin C-terminal hydrolase
MSRGVKGLQNLGNTCYMNSIIQCLSHTVSSTRYFISKDFLNKLKDESTKKDIVINFYNILINLWKDCENKSLNISSFKSSIDKNFPQFRGYNQHDAGEFLVELLDCLHEEISYSHDFEIIGEVKSKSDQLVYDSYQQFKDDYKDKYSKMAEIFYGQTASILIFPNPEHITHKFEEFNHISLPITSKTNNIYQCFDVFSEVDSLDDIEYTIEEAGLKNTDRASALKKQFIFRVPKVLILILKRFDNHEMKISKLIDFPIDNLDISNYVLDTREKKTKYSLYGLVNHYGNTGGGHYTACCKNNGIWYNFNDSNVSVISDLSELVDESVYILFYKQKD